MLSITLSYDPEQLLLSTQFETELYLGKSLKVELSGFRYLCINSVQEASEGTLLQWKGVLQQICMTNIYTNINIIFLIQFNYIQQQIFLLVEFGPTG